MPLNWGVSKSLTTSFVHEEDREGVSAELKQYSTKDGKDYISEYRIVRADGEVAWVKEKSISRMTLNNRVIQTIGVMQDITATKQHEKELREARDSLGDCSEFCVNVKTLDPSDHRSSAASSRPSKKMANCDRVRFQF